MKKTNGAWTKTMLNMEDKYSLENLNNPVY